MFIGLLKVCLTYKILEVIRSKLFNSFVSITYLYDEYCLKKYNF